MSLWLARQGLRFDDEPENKCHQMWNLASPAERDRARAEIAHVVEKHITSVLLGRLELDAFDPVERASLLESLRTGEPSLSMPDG